MTSNKLLWAVMMHKTKITTLLTTALMLCSWSAFASTNHEIPIAFNDISDVTIDSDLISLVSEELENPSERVMLVSTLEGQVMDIKMLNEALALREAEKKRQRLGRSGRIFLVSFATQFGTYLAMEGLSELSKRSQNQLLLKSILGASRASMVVAFVTSITMFVSGVVSLWTLGDLILHGEEIFPPSQ